MLFYAFFFYLYKFQVICSFVVEFYNATHCSFCCFVFLPGRFRQIEVLTTVANAFSSLYSQVSGTPLQKIGSMNSTASSKEVSSPPPLPPPLTRSNTASRLMKTLSKLNLGGNPQAGENGSCPALLPSEKGQTENGLEEGEVKNESKLPKPFKTSSLATVKEEVPSTQYNTMEVLSSSGLLDGTQVPREMQGDTVLREDEQSNEAMDHLDGFHKRAAAIGSSLGSTILDSTSYEIADNPELQIPPTSTPDKQPCALLTNPSIANLMLQQKDSFEMEEVSGKNSYVRMLTFILFLETVS